MDLFKKHEKIKITYNVKLIRVVHIPSSTHKRELLVSWKRGSKKDNRGESKRYNDAADVELGDSFKVVQAMKQELKTSKFDDKKLEFVLSEVSDKKTSSIGKGTVNLADCSSHGVSKELVVSLSKKDPRFELIVTVTPEWQKIGMKVLVKPEDAAAKGLTDTAEKVTLAGGEHFVLQTADEITATDESHQSGDDDDSGVDFEAEDKKHKSQRLSMNLGSSAVISHDDNMRKSQRSSVALGSGVAALTPERNQKTIASSGSISPRGVDQVLKRDPSIRSSTTMAALVDATKKEDEKRKEDEKKSKDDKDKKEKKEKEEKEKREKKEKKEQEKKDKEDKEREKRAQEEKEKKEKEDREREKRDKEEKEKREREEKERREKEEKERKEKEKKDKEKEEKQLRKMRASVDLEKLHEEVARLHSLHKTDEEKVSQLTSKLSVTEGVAQVLRADAASLQQRIEAAQKELQAELKKNEVKQAELTQALAARTAHDGSESAKAAQAAQSVAAELKAAHEARASADAQALESAKAHAAIEAELRAHQVAAAEAAKAHADLTQLNASLEKKVHSLEEEKTLGSSVALRSVESAASGDRYANEVAAATAGKREAEELLVRFKQDMQVRLETLQTQLAEEHESVLALEEEKKNVTPRTAEAAEARAIKAEEALKATTTAAQIRTAALEAEVATLKREKEAVLLSAAASSTPRGEDSKLKSEMTLLKKSLADKDAVLLQVKSEHEEKVADLEKKLAKEKKRSKKIGDGEAVLKLREEAAVSEASLKAQLSDALSRLVVAEQKSAAVPVARVVNVQAIDSGEKEEMEAKLRAATEASERQCAEIDALKADVEKGKKDFKTQLVESAKTRKEEEGEMIRRIAAELDATKTKLKEAEAEAMARAQERALVAHSTPSVEPEELEKLRSRLMESDKRVGVYAADAAHLRAKLDATLDERRKERDLSQEKEAATRASEAEALKSKLSDALLRISELQDETEREKRKRSEEKERRQGLERQVRGMEEGHDHANPEMVHQLEAKLKLKEDEAVRMNEKLLTFEKSMASGGEQPGATVRAQAAEERVKQMYIVLAAIITLVLLRVVF